jgi:hypothetical protein
VIVVILGMHRSGTSMLSSIIHSLGISMGPEADLKRNNPQSQPYGYWEDQSFVAINRQIIHNAGGHWHKPPGRLKILAASMDYRDEISKLIEKRQESDNWGWKDPRNCLCIECYQYVLAKLPDVRYVHIVRDREAIARSLIKRGEALSGAKDQAKAWKQLAYEHERRVRDFFNRFQPARYTVSYEDILKHPKHEVGRLALFLGVSDNALIEVATGRVKR